MFGSATDHRQGAHLFLVKITELKMWISVRGYGVMRQHNVFCFYVVFGVVRRADSAELPDDDQLLIETCRSAFKCF
jgi:hypothetical protein